MAAACAVCAECGGTRMGCACHGFSSAPRAAAKRGEVQCAVDALGGVWGFFFWECGVNVSEFGSKLLLWLWLCLVCRGAAISA